MPPLNPFSTQTFPLKIAHKNTLDFIQVFEKHFLIAHFAQSLTSKYSVC